jgi:Flp pilus assembly protein TadG
MAALIRRLRRSEDGAELIEMAIVMPLLLLLIMSIVDFGFLFQRYVVLTNAAAEGARVASLPGYTAADVTARVNAYAVNGGVPGAVTVATQAVALPGAVRRTDCRDFLRHHGRQRNPHVPRHHASPGGGRSLSSR